MKKTSLLLLIFILGMWSCSQTVGPVPEAGSQQGISEPNWIQLPKADNASLPKVVTVTEKVKKDKNTKLEINEDYDGGPFGKVKIRAKLEFKKNSLEEDTEISMSLDTDNGVITILPHMVLNDDAELEYTLGGQELAEGDEEAIGFVYMAEDGSYDPIDNLRIKVKVDKGDIELMRGQLPHFSRFGFTR